MDFRSGFIFETISGGRLYIDILALTRKSCSSKRLLSDHGSRRLVVDVEVSRAALQGLGGLFGKRPEKVT
jgi:hypothetical protein